MATVSETFLINLAQSVGISFDMKKNALGSVVYPNSVLFSLKQISSLINTGKPIFGVYDNPNSFASLIFNYSLSQFQISSGQVFYNTNLYTVASQTITAKASDDLPGQKYFQFYLDYNDFNLASTVFTSTITAINTLGNIITVNQLPNSSYLNNFQQININGYLVGVIAINSSTNQITLNQSVLNYAFIGATINLIFQPIIRTIITTSVTGTPAIVDIPSTGIALANALLYIDSNYNYTCPGGVITNFIGYPIYSSPLSLFPTTDSYNSFNNAINSSIAIFSGEQNYTTESQLLNSFINYTTGISSTKSTFDNYWYFQPYKPTGIFQYGIGYQGLQKVDFDSRFKNFYYNQKNKDLTRTLAVFRGDIYGGNAYVGQSLGRFPGSVSINNLIDYSNTSTLTNGTQSYGVSAVTPAGEYVPLFNSSANFYFNSKVNNYISWTSSSISNLLFFHVYKNLYGSNGFEQLRLTSPFSVLSYTLSDTILPNSPTYQGIGSSHFAFNINGINSSNGIIGGIYFNASIIDNTALSGIQSAIIINPGNNYISPYAVINGTGQGAQISLTTSMSGGISNASVISLGSGYNSSTTISIFDAISNSGGNGAIIQPIMSTLNCGIYTGNNLNPVGSAIAQLEPIPIYSIPNTITPVNMNLLGQNFVGLNSNTNYWAVFTMNTPYALKNTQYLNFYNSVGFAGSYASSNNGQTWVSGNTSSQIAKLGFLDKGTNGTTISSRGVYLTNDHPVNPSRLRISIPNLDISSLTFNDIGYNGTGIGTSSLPTQNSMNVYVNALNSITGFSTTLIGVVPKNTKRGTYILLGSNTDLYDTVTDVFVEPNLSLGVNYISNTNVINWTIYDFITVDTSP